jgi:Rrf2 family nitric oxide-sensitive transcriptional repressor
VRLTKHSDYALRVMVFVAAAEGRLVSTAEIGQAYEISAHHLVKIVNELGKTGFLAIKRGRSGGVSLGRDAADIRIGEIVTAMEPDFALVECMEAGNKACALTGACGLVAPLREAQRAFIAALDRYTLADVIGSRGRAYRKLLGISRLPSSARARVAAPVGE